MKVVMLSSMDNFLQLLGVTALFIFVLILTYFTTKLVSGVKSTREKGSNFKVIETYKVAPNKFLQIVQIDEHYIVISVGKDDIQYITELSKEEITTPELSTLNLSFSDILSKITKNQQK